MSVAEMVERAHAAAISKGFWTPPRDNVGEHLALIATEIMEFEDAVSDAARLEELADIVIRVFDLCGYLGYELSETVLLFRPFDYSTNVYGFAHKAYRHVARATQAHRKDDDKGAGSWLSSLVVHCAMYSAFQFGRELEKEIRAKMEKNRDRPRLHGRLY